MSFIIKDYSLLFKYDIFNYFLIQLNNLHFYILKHLFIPDIVQVLFKLYHAFFYFVHINIMDQLYYSNLLEQYFYFPNKRAKKPLFFSFSNSFFNFSISFNCSFFLDLVVLLIDLFLLTPLLYSFIVKAWNKLCIQKRWQRLKIREFLVKFHYLFCFFQDVHPILLAFFLYNYFPIYWSIYKKISLLITILSIIITT